EKPVRVPCGLQPLHAPFPLAGGLVGVFGAILGVPVLAVVHPPRALPLRPAIPFPLVWDDHARDVRQPLEQLAEALLGRLLVPPTLHEHVEPIPVLIDRPPPRVPFAMHREAYLGQGPYVARPGAPVTPL